MKRVIHKQPLNEFRDNTIVGIGGFVEALSVGLDPQGNICLWFIRDLELMHQSHSVTVMLRWTGEEPPIDGKFMGTFVQDALVYHAWVL